MVAQPGTDFNLETAVNAQTRIAVWNCYLDLRFGTACAIIILGAGWLPAPSWFGRLLEIGTALLP